MRDVSFRDLFSRNLFSRFFAKPSAPAPDRTPEWLIVGLGNPGTRYATTRHNVGYMGVDKLLDEFGAQLRPVPGRPASVAHVELGDTPVALVRSTTYMNESGNAVAALAEEWEVAPERIILLHDELDLPLGTVRIKLGGNENGHNGLKSTSARLGTRDYVRIRMGISRPPKGMAVPDYVLGAIEEGPATDAMVDKAARAARLVVEKGVAKAQNEIH